MLCTSWNSFDLTTSHNTNKKCIYTSVFSVDHTSVSLVDHSFPKIVGNLYNPMSTYGVANKITFVFICLCVCERVRMCVYVCACK